MGNLIEEFISHPSRYPCYCCPLTLPSFKCSVASQSYSDFSLQLTVDLTSVLHRSSYHAQYTLMCVKVVSDSEYYSMQDKHDRPGRTPPEGMLDLIPKLTDHYVSSPWTGLMGCEAVPSDVQTVTFSLVTFTLAP